MFPNHRSGPAVSVVVAVLGLAAAPSHADPELPDGFALETVALVPSGSLPTCFAVLPDRRVLVAHAAGELRLDTVASDSAHVVHTIPQVRTDYPERGVLGLAVDPAWPDRPYVYVYFTHTMGGHCLRMLEASGDLVDPVGPNLVLSNPYDLLTGVPDNDPIHNAGTLRFGPDGMLYLSIGDDGWGCSAQEPTYLSGAVLRLNVSAMPGAGSGPPPRADLAPPDNPFPGPDENERLVWAFGLRNPFRFGIDPETGDLFLGDVGNILYEELDLIEYGAQPQNFGWPLYEGPVDSGLGLTCGEQYTHTFPIWWYQRDLFEPQSIVPFGRYRPVPGSPPSFPPAYDGSVFVFEFWEGWVRRIVDDGTGTWGIAPPVAGQPAPDVWAEGLFSTSDVQRGPEGALYLCRYSSSLGEPQGIFRIVSDGSATAAGLPSPEQGDLSVFPNPVRAGRTFRVRFTAVRSGRHSFTLHDVAGRLVARRDLHVTAPGPHVLANLAAGIPPGTYFLRVSGPGTRRSGAVTITPR